MLIELKDGDTVIVTVPDDNGNWVEMCEKAFGSGTPVHLVYGFPFSVTVYRPPVVSKDAEPAEEHDGWHPMHTAPRDGQAFDVWVVDSPFDGHQICGVFFVDGLFRVLGGKPIGSHGTPTHWRYPVKGPKA